MRRALIEGDEWHATRAAAFLVAWAIQKRRTHPPTHTARRLRHADEARRTHAVERRGRRDAGKARRAFLRGPAADGERRPARMHGSDFPPLETELLHRDALQTVRAQVQAVGNAPLRAVPHGAILACETERLARAIVVRSARFVARRGLVRTDARESAAASEIERVDVYGASLVLLGSDVTRASRRFVPKGYDVTCHTAGTASLRDRLAFLYERLAEPTGLARRLFAIENAAAIVVDAVAAGVLRALAAFGGYTISILAVHIAIAVVVEPVRAGSGTPLFDLGRRARQAHDEHQRRWSNGQAMQPHERIVSGNASRIGRVRRFAPFFSSGFTPSCRP